MKEIRDIVRAYEIACQQGKRTALATVVQVEGSSYRRPGARMLVTEDGQFTGAISGGCLEGDALRKAQLVMAQDKAMLVTYDTTDEDDAKLGVGLGCNGIIHILIEPVNAGQLANPVYLLQQLLCRRQSAVIVTLFSLADRRGEQPGTCMILLEDGTVCGNIPGIALKEEIRSDMQAVFSSRIAVTQTYQLDNGVAINAFIAYTEPAVSLVIAGAGNDVMPLVAMADILGWQVTIIDGRANYVTRQRFPAVHNLVVAKPEQALLPLHIDKRTVFVLMTHNYNYDLAILQQLITMQVPYTGILGPRKKLQRMLNEPDDNGGAINCLQRARIFGPVGLDIGAETPEEIALSVVAEIQAVISGATAKTLRDKQETIHARPREIRTIPLSKTG